MFLAGVAVVAVSCAVAAEVWVEVVGGEEQADRIRVVAGTRSNRVRMNSD